MAPARHTGLFFCAAHAAAPEPAEHFLQELHDDSEIQPPRDGTLTKWLVRGVPLLNTTLTVCGAGRPTATVWHTRRLSAYNGFWMQRHFSSASAFLEHHNGIAPID